MEIRRNESVNKYDSYVAAQILARSRSAVVKIKFLNFRSRYPHGLILAVEGNDDKVVYSYWIKRISPEISYEFFVCNNKNELKFLRNCLYSDKSKESHDVGFIVDRDFDDLENFHCIGDVFMLDRYSIENYIVDKFVVHDTVKVALPGSGDPKLREKICNIFDKDYEKFLDVVSEINRQLFFARRLRMNVDNCIPDSLAKLAVVQLGEVRPCDPPAEVAFKIELDLLQETAKQLDEEFSLLDPKKRYRGKFSYKFLRGWLDRLSDEYRNAHFGLFPPSEEAAGRIKHDEMSLGSLACRSSLPEGFETFVLHLSGAI